MAFKHLTRTDVDDHIEISILSAAQTGVSLTGNAELAAGINAGADVDMETFLLSHSALT